MRRYAHFQAPIVPLKGMSYNIWGDHFHPIIATAAPLYWIWGHPETLLILQAALIASSVPVIYRFARRRTTSRASLVICFAYASSWAFQTLVDFQVHEVAWGVPILALAIDALDRADDKQLLIFAGLLLLVREDMGILVVLLGILRLFNRRRRWIGLILVAAGVIVYELATAVILPHFSPDQHFAYWQYGPTLGPNLGSALGHVVLHPLDTARLFFSPMIKTQTLLLFLVPVLFLALRSRYSILALPLAGAAVLRTRGTGQPLVPQLSLQRAALGHLRARDDRRGRTTRRVVPTATQARCSHGDHHHSYRADRRESAVLRTAGSCAACDAERQAVQHDHAHASSAGRRRS